MSRPELLADDQPLLAPHAGNGAVAPVVQTDPLTQPLPPRVGGSSARNDGPLDPRRPLWGRRHRNLAGRLLLHLTLICLAIVFLFPFVWMLGMSVKTDEEATSTQLFPSIPSFREASPFVRAPADVPQPATVSTARWAGVQRAILDQCAAAVHDVPVPKSAAGCDVTQLRQSATTSLAATLVGRQDQTRWDSPDADAIRKTMASMTPDEPAAAVMNAIGSLQVRGLQMRSLQEETYTIQKGDDLARGWKVESGNASLSTLGGDGALLQYHFSSAGDSPIVLSTQFTSPVSADQLYRMIVSLQCDNSWHRVYARMQIGNRAWESTEPYYVGQFRTASIVLQPPGPLESPYEAQTWTRMHEVTTLNQQPWPATRGELRLTIEPSSTLAATWGKLERNYVRAFRSVPFWMYIGNSTVLVAMQVIGALFSSAFVAYAFARLNWPGRSVAFGLLLSTMMLPSQVTMIPSFLIWRSLGLYNTLTPLWAGAWLGNAFFIFLMTQNMRTIPKELDEAARIDGMNALQTWWYVIVPQVKPSLAAIAIFTFMGAWNEFMGPLIMLRDQAKFPLSLGLFGMRIDAQNDWTMLMAGNMLMILPVIIIFFLFQRYFIEGVTVSGMKG